MSADSQAGTKPRAKLVVSQTSVRGQELNVSILPIFKNERMQPRHLRWSPVTEAAKLGIKGRLTENPTSFPGSGAFGLQVG